jgi:predicted amidophosphoribosyltransferase
LGELGAEARRAVVAGAFVVAPRRVGLLAGRRVLLIDEVLTSGATADACAEALLAAGVASVEVLAAARVAAPGGRGRA